MEQISGLLQQGRKERCCQEHPSLDSVLMGSHHAIMSLSYSDMIMLMMWHLERSIGLVDGIVVLYRKMESLE
jgi:hypothetical protein